jgi:hypothetical protein
MNWIQVSTLVSDSSRIASDARKIIRSGPYERTPAATSQRSSRYEDYALDYSRLVFHAGRQLALFKFKIGWDAHRSKYITGDNDPR